MRIKTSLKSGLIIPNKTILEPGEFGATIELVVREGIFKPDGRITDLRPERRSESFVKQFMQLLMINMTQVGERNLYAVKDTSAVIRYPIQGLWLFNVNAAIGDEYMGIMVGTGMTAPTINDYVMETRIVHGVGTSQLQYSAITYGAPVSDSTTSQFTITRNFANGSGGSITVKEIGLYVKGRQGYLTAENVYFMTLHDLVDGGSGIAVLNGQTLTVNYRPQAVI